MDTPRTLTGSQFHATVARLERDALLRFEKENCELLEAQNKATTQEQQEDPTRSVLIGPRLRGSVIERVVMTYARRVGGEFLHETGWRRHGPIDLRVILSGEPVPTCYAKVMSDPGELDLLPTDEALRQFREIDPEAQFSDDPRLYRYVQGLLFFEEESAESVRLTEAELRHPMHSEEPGRSAADATNAEIAAEILSITPGLWHSVTMAVRTTDQAGASGFTIQLWGMDRSEGYYEPTARLRVLVARRFELMEDRPLPAWKAMTFTVSRAALPEWRCEVRYEF